MGSLWRGSVALLKDFTNFLINIDVFQFWWIKSISYLNDVLNWISQLILIECSNYSHSAQICNQRRIRRAVRMAALLLIKNIKYIGDCFIDYILSIERYQQAAFNLFIFISFLRYKFFELFTLKYFIKYLLYRLFFLIRFNHGITSRDIIFNVLLHYIKYYLKLSTLIFDLCLITNNFLNRINQRTSNQTRWILPFLDQYLNNIVLELIQLGRCQLATFDDNTLI